MTFFLPPRDQDSAKVKGRGLPLDDPPSFGSGIGASYEQTLIEGNRNLTVQKKSNQTEIDRAREAVSILGTETIATEARRRGVPETFIRGLETGAIEHGTAIPPEMLSVIRDMSAEAREKSPSEWADVDLSQEGVTRTVNEQIQSELDEAQAVIDLMPGGRGAAALIGGMAGSVFSIKDAPWLFIGFGGGSMLRVAGREASINMAAEGAILPSQFAMAERLDLPEPDVATQLAIAAAGGAAFGTAIEAGARGIRYFQARRQASELRDALGRLRDDVEAEMMLDDAEGVLSEGGVDAMERLAEIPDRFPERPPFDVENPINPERPPLIPEMQGDIAQPGDLTPETVTTTPLDAGPREPLSDENLIETMRAGIDEAEAEANLLQPRRRSLPRFFRGTGDGSLGGNVGIDPNGPAGRELKSLLGTNNLNQLAPGTFRRGGRQDVDNLVASEMEEMFPGITEAAGMSPDGNYLDRQGVLDVLARDLQGDTSWLRSAQDAQRLRTQAAETERAIETGQPAVANYRQTDDPAFPDSTYIDPETFIDPSDIEVAVDLHLRGRGIDGIVTPAERGELLNVMETQGGDVDSALAMIWEREINYEKRLRRQADERAPDTDTSSPDEGGRSASGRTGLDAREQREPDAGAVGGRGAVDEPSGQQSIPGTERVETGQAQRDRAEIAARQQQSRLGRLDQERVEDDAGGLFSTRPRDMFDDVAGPEARVVHDAVEADIRDGIETTGDFNTALEMPDGSLVNVRVSDGLDRLNEIEAFSARIDLCGKGP